MKSGESKAVDTNRFDSAHMNTNSGPAYTPQTLSAEEPVCGLLQRVSEDEVWSSHYRPIERLSRFAADEIYHQICVRFLECWDLHYYHLVTSICSPPGPSPPKILIPARRLRVHSA